jgi:protein ImuB
LLIRTAEPTRDMAHLARLSAEQLARRTLSAPAHTLCLQSVEVQPLPTASASLLMEEQRQGDSLHQLVERLGARLGPQQVLCLRPQADHRPEHMQLLCEASSALPLLAGGARQPARSAWDDIDNTALYPSWLLRTPLRLALQDNRPLYQGPLQLLVGPQRLEVLGWPQVDAPQAVLRDYFIALSPHAGLLWVYRERLPPALPGAVATPAWYLHGIYA